ncbi:unnamed protein product [Linum tenue]|uniref:Uncharacterized protein n=1 Tax=Linum tenue TaxID=586396 RepID=A0AAV0QL46_9ROSI|nr:unnamed protein product [Linum tenue]
MATKSQFLPPILPIPLCLFIAFLPEAAPSWPLPSEIAAGGAWVLLHQSIGISVMHMQVLRNNKVMMFDRTDFGTSNISLPDGKCRFDVTLSPVDCTAHSVLYDLASNTIRPLVLQTNTWCSSGSLDADGTLIQTGGHDEGERVVRSFAPCDDNSCDWVELYDTSLMNRRWYATNQILPDGRIIIVGGRSVFTYEFYPKSSSSSSQFDNQTLNFLWETRDPDEENNLYPFLHLLPDGNLFIFANNRSILFDYSANQVIKEYPVMPGGDRRNYPCTGSSVLLPLRLTECATPTAEVMICGGAPPGAFAKANNQSIYVEASRTCGRMTVSDPNPQWVMEQMPGPRLMAALSPDGRILVGGSNPHPTYNFTAGPYLTELSLEAFDPGYLNPDYAHLRPSILTVESSIDGTVKYQEMFSVSLMLPFPDPYEPVAVVLIAPSFSTHSFGMNQRMVVLGVERQPRFGLKMNVIGPKDVNVAPPGYYMLFIVHHGIPSPAVWVKVR